MTTRVFPPASPQEWPDRRRRQISSKVIFFGRARGGLLRPQARIPSSSQGRGPHRRDRSRCVSVVRAGRYIQPSRNKRIGGQVSRYLTEHRAVGHPGGREKFIRRHASFLHEVLVNPPQRISKFVQVRPLHSRTIVRSGFVAFNTLARVFWPHQRGALS